MLKFKALFIILFASLNLYSIEVVVSNKEINYNELIHLNNLKKFNVSKIKKICKPLTYKDFQHNKFIATHILKKGSILCKRDVKEYKKNFVVFNFGSIQIEREGKVIFENDDYIKIKKRDGKIEKIFKDGRLQ